MLYSARGHGVPAGDLFGARHFRLRDELEEFIRRIRTLDISFYLSHGDGLQLAERLDDGLVSDEGFGPDLQFDRIFLSISYLRYDKILGAWGPKLKKTEENEQASLVISATNWLTRAPGELSSSLRPALFDHTAAPNIIRRLQLIGQVCLSVPAHLGAR